MAWCERVVHTTWYEYMCFFTCLVALRCAIVVTSCYIYIQCFFETQHFTFHAGQLETENQQFLASCHQVTMGSLRWRHNSQCHSGSSNPAEALPAWACMDLRRSQWREHFDTLVALRRCSSTLFVNTKIANGSSSPNFAIAGADPYNWICSAPRTRYCQEEASAKGANP